ncbi:EF hand [Ancylostoma ceylanicum]|uniref:EF hand n=1 Tax=Ancylostoma ceylanicum TaxID=53326 RepID=A0A0D6LNT1_9BILA|nr:EF hand [Ancylostoma ceylanicum]
MKACLCWTSIHVRRGINAHRVIGRVPAIKWFHYFSLNDLNKDNKLDGNEIGKALWHSHGDQQAPIMTDDEIANVVDSVLKDMDLDGDGFIDYTEYATKML